MFIPLCCAVYSREFKSFHQQSRSLNSPTLHRMLFFTDYGNVAKVARCNMDGTNRTQLVDYRIELPTAVALDVVRKLVYWADAYLDYIDVVDYDGKNRHSIVHGSKVSWVVSLVVSAASCHPGVARHKCFLPIHWRGLLHGWVFFINFLI